MKIKFVMLLFIILRVYNAKSQEEAIFSQYTMYQYLINPAFAGSDGYTSYDLAVRQQWFGIDNAPLTQAISWQTRILKIRPKKSRFKNRINRQIRSGKIGLGASLYNDRNGQVGRTNMEVTFAYHIFIGRSQLSMGLSLQAYQFRVNTDELKPLEGNDPLIEGARQSMFMPDGSVGIFYKDQPFYIGISARNLFQAALKFGGGNRSSNYRQVSHYYISTGYMYDMDNDFEIEPSIILKTTENFNLETDVSLKGYYKRDYWLGIAYKNGNAFTTTVGIKINELFIGYSFEYSLNDIKRISYGSYEIFLGWRLGDNTRRYRWLDRY